MSDGTTYTFAMSTCETSENGADGLPREADGLDLGRAIVDATGDDHVDLAVREIQEAVVVERSDVAEREHDFEGRANKGRECAQERARRRWRPAAVGLGVISCDTND
ncbi:hypothetical protein [Ilumatobacter sp.]|uniref:hypothetical protein n=1 Tax=Ilumatobacter sp. TaxID=1967498 RepID=UPI003C60F136